MITIKFQNHSGIKVYFTFDMELTKIIFTETFHHYVDDLHCTWAEVGEDGLTNVERIEKQYGRGVL